jgi:hypothetical protein
MKNDIKPTATLVELVAYIQTRRGVSLPPVMELRQ